MYFKFILSFILLSATVLSAYSQSAFERDMSNNLRVFDANGKIFANPNKDIAGSPYFIEIWKYGIVTLSNNAVYSKRLLRLDIESQEIHYLSETNFEMTLPTGYIKEVSFIDSAQNPFI